MGNPYRFKKDGGTITEVGMYEPTNGKLEKVKFNTPVKILTNEPTWVALSRRIVELETQLAEVREYVDSINVNTESIFYAKVILQDMLEESDE